MPEESRAKTILKTLLVLGTGVGGFSLACQETLPPYDEPQVFLAGGAYASYTYAEDNMLTISASVTNSYDEVLQDKAVLGGQLRITPQMAPGFSRTIQLTPGNLVQTQSYDPLTRMLTLDPKETIWMEAKWDFRDDRRRDLRDSLFKYVTDPTCSLRTIARRQVFTIEASVVVFSKLGHVSCAPIVVSLCYIDSYADEPNRGEPIDRNICPLIDPGYACALVEAPGE